MCFCRTPSWVVQWSLQCDSSPSLIICPLKILCFLTLFRQHLISTWRPIFNQRLQWKDIQPLIHYVTPLCCPMSYFPLALVLCARAGEGGGVVSVLLILSQPWDFVSHHCLSIFIETWAPASRVFTYKYPPAVLARSAWKAVMLFPFHSWPINVYIH